MRKILTLAVLALSLAVSAHADPVLSLGVGAQGAWYDNQAYPSDFELGGNAAMSLTPHISGTGEAYYGLNRSYLRGALGVLFTVTDANDPNFSIGAGLQYRASSEPAVSPEGFAPCVAIGWRAWPQQLPNVLLVAKAVYGLDEDSAALYAGVRLVIPTE